MHQKLKLIRLILPLLACFGLAPMAQAVGPDTDGSIPGSNNGEGVGVLVNLGGGIWNTGTGFEALNQDTVGRLNTATGVRALFSDTSGSYNTAHGVQALYTNGDGWFNSAFGAYALANNVEADGNTAVGYAALWKNIQAYSTAVGYAALYKNTTGFANTAVGAYALFNNTTSGNSSNAVGYQSLFSQTTGLYNNGFGWNALYSNVTGNYNTAIGDGAGSGITGSGNVCIGEGVSGFAGENDTTRIRNIANTPLNTGMFVEVDANGKLGFITSSRRYKHDIEPMANASEALFALKPVTFRYNGEIDPAHVKMFGLIAEDVAKVSPNLAVRDAKGEVVAIRSDSINAMLLNEFLKEHRRVEDLQATVAQQQKGMEVLTAQLKEQAAQIQKVSAQLETNKPAPQVVVNTP